MKAFCASDPTGRTAGVLRVLRFCLRHVMICLIVFGFVGTMDGQIILVPIVPRTDTPPVLDGKVSWNEWSGAYGATFEQGSIKLLYDDVRLYILINVIDEQINDPEDYFYATFDVDRDGVPTPNVDLNYTLHPTTGNLPYQYALGPWSWTFLQPETRSAMGRGFGSSFADGTVTIVPKVPWGWSISFQRHRVWELGIDLAEINAGAGNLVHFGLRVSSPAEGFTTHYPGDYLGDFSEMKVVRLANHVPYLIDTQASLGLTQNPLEVTQAIQTPDNALPLVAHKKTAARVYVYNRRSTFAQPVRVYLYGRKGDLELPGSPLAQHFFAPSALNPDRANLQHSANFAIPASWAEGGNVTFTAVLRTALGGESESAVYTIPFVNKEVPTIWTIPVNTGTASSPVLISDDQMALQEEFMRRVYPLADIHFVRKPWTAIGTTTVADTISVLRDYHSDAVLAWIFGVIFTGHSPFDLPTQVYGFCPSGGGISDPTWCFGSGHGFVARGYIGTSRELTMAHEINHNLDLDAAGAGTWGRHTPEGCDAAGPDPAWPYSDDDIQDVGFDPWASPDDPARRKVMHGDWPDFMSYCESGAFPTKWISPYRWNALFNRFATTATPFGIRDSRNAALIQQIENSVYYISGSLFPDGTGKLDPVVVQPGIPSGAGQEGPHSVRVLNSLGTTLASVNFPITFTGPEGDSLSRFEFLFQIPTQKGATEIVLTNGKAVLDRIVMSKAPPVVEMLSPNGGESWKGKQQVQWKLSDPDGDLLWTSLFYSPDDGASWVPLANRIKGDRLIIDFSVLPGGSAARMRAVVTDGFRTVSDDSDAPFKVARNAPVVTILNPLQEAVLPAGHPIPFAAEANDPEDQFITETPYIWFLQGQPFGLEPRFEATLPVGDYEVSVMVEDSDGMVGVAETVFKVRESIAILRIKRLSDGRVELSWPLNQPGILQSSSSPTGPFGILKVVPVVEGDRFVVILLPSSEQRYFRLMLSEPTL